MATGRLSTNFEIVFSRHGNLCVTLSAIPQCVIHMLSHDAFDAEDPEGTVFVFFIGQVVMGNHTLADHTGFKKLYSLDETTALSHPLLGPGISSC